MRFRVLACLSVFALTILFANGATPQTESSHDYDRHSSIEFERTFLARTQLPNLRGKVDANCSSIPLRDFLANLAEQTNTVIYLDERNFANTQPTFDKPVSITLDKKISLDSALTLALDPYHLAHYIKDGRIVVTNESFIVSATEPTK